MSLENQQVMGPNRATADLTMGRVPIPVFERFSGEKPENYQAWKFQLKMYLKALGLWQYIENGLPDIISDIRRKYEETRARDEAIKKAVEKEDITMSVLSTSVSTQVISEVLKLQQINNSKEMFNEITKRYSPSNAASLILLECELEELSLKDERNIESFIERFTTNIAKQRLLGRLYHDRELVLKFFAKLNGRFASFRQGTIAIDPNLEKTKFSELINTLRTDLTVAKSQTVKTEETEESAYMVKSKAKAKHGEYKRTFKTKTKGPKTGCYSCGGSHYKVNCPNLKPKNDSKNNHELAFCLQENLKESNCNEWILDSGCTKHISPYISDFTWYSEFNENERPVLSIAEEKRKLVAIGFGTIIGSINTDNGKKKLTLKNVYHIPGSSHRLLSVKEISSKGYCVTFRESTYTIRSSDRATLECIAITGSVKDKLYVLQMSIQTVDRVLTANQSNGSLELWHRRFCHFSFDAVRKAIEQRKMKIASSIKSNCEACIKGKTVTKSFPKSVLSRATETLYRIHSDLCGPFPESIGKSKYFVLFVDDCSRFTWCYTIASKNQVFEVFEQFDKMITNQTGKTIKRLRTDNGGEYVSTQFANYLKQRGILHEKTIPHNPEQNGVSERNNRTVVEATRTLLCSSSLDQRFWAEALHCSVYVKNLCPTRVNDMKSPHEVFYGEIPDIYHLRTFGCRVYSHIDKKQPKLMPRVIEGVMVGYAKDAKGYRIWDGKRIIVSRSVKFEEDTCHDIRKGDSVNNNMFEDRNVIDTVEFRTNVNENLDDVSQHESNDEDDEADGTEATERPKRNCKIPEKYRDFVLNATLIDVPSSYREAIESENSREWKIAMDEEMSAHEKNETWITVDANEDYKLIDSKWIYTVKQNYDGSIDKFKARLVARGFMQTKGKDYTETFSPVVAITTLRFLLNLVCQKNLCLKQLDVSTAYLNGTISEELYMKPPEGYAEKGKVCKLVKSIYGLKQASRAWNNRLNIFFEQIKFNRSKVDPCLYFRITSESKTWIAVYVDDFVIISSDQRQLNAASKLLEEEFSIRDTTNKHLLLGIRLTWGPEKSYVHLDQEVLTLKLLEKFKMHDCRPAKTPFASGFYKDFDDGQTSEPYDVNLYKQLIGTMMYLALYTRPDICFAVNYLSRFSEAPDMRHFVACKRILRYLKGTSSYGIKYERSDGTNDFVVAYSDADWASDRLSRRSTSGYMVLIANSLISWRCQRQRSVALSTVESEFVAMSICLQDLLWYKDLLREAFPSFSSKIIFYSDNQGAIAVARNESYSSKLKHISIRMSFVKDVVKCEDISLAYKCTEEMLADIFTKVLPGGRFEALCSLLRICGRPI